ncbi:MerR family transcriptional regulator [Clostridium perfringens]|nr:MerR family transcriptional regulator [Clostridium perfringens]
MRNSYFFTVGELAKEMDVTVRTLQYYDKEGLLKPSAKSEGGRRLYSKKDMVKLHQILSLKYLGFSLDEIKDKLFSLDDPLEVSEILAKQADILRKQINQLKVALDTTESLREEVIKIKTVDFSKYADIVSLLKQENENYWLIKLFDDKLSSHIREKFNNDSDAGINIFNKYSQLLDKTLNLKNQGESPSSKISLSLAEEWWNMINDFTKGDLSLLPNLMEFNNKKENWKEDMAIKQNLIDDFLGESLNYYFQSKNINILNSEDN